MGDNWISRIIVNAVAAPVANAVASAGGMAGGAVGGVGNAINGVGKSVEGSIRYYGDGVKDYGNAIQDWTKASGARQATANNPLGLGGSQVAGKLAFTGGGKSKPAEKKPPIKAPRGDPRASAQKALQAPGPKPTAATRAPAAKTPAAKPKTAATGGPKPKTSAPASGKTRISAESRPAKAKPRTAAPKSSYGPSSGAAKDPLGIGM